MLLAKCLQQLKRQSETDFSLEFMVMDPGYHPANRALIEENASRMRIPIRILESDIFDAVVDAGQSPCYLCARMRRGALHDAAKEKGCNKIALGHHWDDAGETFLLNLFHEGRIGCFSPVSYLSRKDLTMIRPLVFAPERDIGSAQRRCRLPVVKSKCPADTFTQRQWAKEYLDAMEKEHPGFKKRLIFPTSG